MDDQPFYDWEKTLNERDKDLVEKAFNLMVKQMEKFRKDFPLKAPDEPKEYQCFLLDPYLKMCHIDGTCMLETDDLYEACGLVYRLFTDYGIEACVYQPRHQTYREYYRNEE